MNELENCFNVKTVKEEYTITPAPIPAPTEENPDAVIQPPDVIIPVGTVDLTRVGNEEFYNVVMRTILADLVAVQILILVGLGVDFTSTVEGTLVQSKGLTTFVKKAKAGSAEVEYEQFDLKKDTASSLMSSTSLLDFYKFQAIRKAHSLGCIIDINTDGALAVSLYLDNTVLVPFISIGGCGCR
jgi:hypothetical protein